jgi:hypothetical protein
MQQMNLFEWHFTHKIRLIELFGGIGSQSKALEVLQSKGNYQWGLNIID